MAESDFVSEIIVEQENTRTDIRALKEEIGHMRTDLNEHTRLLQRVASFQEAQDEREAHQVEMTRDVARIAFSITKLVESHNREIEELTAHLRELRLSASVDTSMGRMIAQMNGLRLVMGERAADKDN